MSVPMSKLRAVGFVTDVFISVAVPAVFFAWAGRTLDQKWHLTPWLTVIGFILAIATSGALVYRKAKKAADEMKNSTP